MKRFSQIHALPALLLLANLSGCGSTPAAKFYLLEASQTSPTQTNTSTLVVMAPVRIPHYLDRAQIVTADGDNGYRLSELNRWAEGLDHNITRVLQQDLSLMVPANVVTAAPAEAAALKLAVTIQEFHVTRDGQASLKAQWQISRDNRLVGLHRQQYQQAAATDDYSKMVAGLNACLARLTGDISATLQQARQP